MKINVANYSNSRRKGKKPHFLIGLLRENYYYESLLFLGKDYWKLKTVCYL